VRRLTLVLLVLLVGGLYWLRGKEDEEISDRNFTVVEKPLTPGLSVGAVQRVRIEHLERNVNLTLERGPSGRWFLVDPISYLAEGALVDSLLSYFENATGPDLQGADLEKLGLAPPRIVVHITQVREGEAEENWRVEFGAIDVDARRVLARVPNHPDSAPGGALVTRVVRSLDTTLDRNPDDYRETLCTTIPAQRVVEISRRGRGDLTLNLDAFLDGGIWRRRDEPRVSLDAGGVALMTRAVTSLRARTFVEDAAMDVSPFGLDDPRIALELRDIDGRRELLLLSTPAVDDELPPLEARWYAMRDGFPHVWSVSPADLRIFMTPTESLYDYAIVRAQEEAVLLIQLAQRGGAGLTLERLEDGWWVEQFGGEAPLRRRADVRKVEGLLAQLIHSELVEYAPPGTFRAGDAALELTIRTESGVDVEATVGEPWRDVESGVEGRLFLRSGEDLAAIAPNNLLALFELTVADLEELLIHAVEESDVDRISIRKGSLEHTYNRRERLWFSGARGQQVTGERAVLLERLLRFEASSWLDDLSQPIQNPIHIGFKGRVGMAFSFGRLADGRLVLDNGERRALLSEDPLQSDLQAAFLATFETSDDE
jgi:hypothetical protein